MDCEDGSKILIAFFSATGITSNISEKIARVTHGDVYEIIPKYRYSLQDLDWQNVRSRSTLEMRDEKCRPEIKEDNIDISDYNAIFIGYPIWWDAAPRVINTFVEKHDLKGKILIPFATSGSSGIEESVKKLRKVYPELQWQDGKLLNNYSERAIKEWICTIM